MSSKGGKGHKKKNKDAIQFILANRELNDPNINNPNATDKILLQVNKDEELTKEQKKIIEAIPKIHRGVYDEEEKIKQMLEYEKKSKEGNEKGVKFGISEVIPFDKNGKVAKEEDEIIDTGCPSKKEHHPKKEEFTIDKKIEEDDKYVDEVFNKMKVTAKIVEYNEFGLPKDTPKEILQYVTNKEFKEGVDIFIPAPVITPAALHAYDNDMKESEMNEEYKEVEAELKSDSEAENKEEKDKKEEKEKEDETNILEDNFILLANEGKLPIEMKKEEDITEEPKDNIKASIDISTGDNRDKKGPSYKFITKEEVEYLKKKFAEEDKKTKYDRKGGQVSKKEFDEAIEEMLNMKKGKKETPKEDKSKKKIMGLTQKFEDEEEFEEYELPDDDEDEEYKKAIEQVEKEQKEKEPSEEEYESMEDDEDKEEEGYKPNIKIEYVSKDDEPDPFAKDEDKEKSGKQNKRQHKKSKTKQYEEQKNLPESERDSDFQEDSFTIEDLNKLTSDKDFVEKTLELYNHHEQNEGEENEEKVNEDIEKNFIHEPRIRKDINSAHVKTGNLPKSVKPVIKQRDYVKPKKEKEEKEETQKVQKDDIIRMKEKNGKETAEEKKLRKKLLKEEKKERRAEKKQMKEAFKKEKHHQQRQIAEANKIIRCGLSVKDI